MRNLIKVLAVGLALLLLPVITPTQAAEAQGVDIETNCEYDVYIAGCRRLVVLVEELPDTAQFVRFGTFEGNVVECGDVGLDQTWCVVQFMIPEGETVATDFGPTSSNPCSNDGVLHRFDDGTVGCVAPVVETDVGSVVTPAVVIVSAPVPSFTG